MSAHTLRTTKFFAEAERVRLSSFVGGCVAGTTSAVHQDEYLTTLVTCQ